MTCCWLSCWPFVAKMLANHMHYKGKQFEPVVLTINFGQCEVQLYLRHSDCQKQMLNLSVKRSAVFYSISFKNDKSFNNFCCSRLKTGENWKVLTLLDNERYVNSHPLSDSLISISGSGHRDQWVLYCAIPYFASTLCLHAAKKLNLYSCFVMTAT